MQVRDMLEHRDIPTHIHKIASCATTIAQQVKATRKLSSHLGIGTQATLMAGLTYHLSILEEWVTYTRKLLEWEEAAFAGPAPVKPSISLHYIF